MSDALDELDIENVTLRLDMDSLRANGFPAIGHIKEGGGSFIVIEDIFDSKIHYYNAKIPLLFFRMKQLCNPITPKQS